MKRYHRMWGSWGLVLLLACSLMAPVVASAASRGGGLIGGYEDGDQPTIIGDPDDGVGGRPQPAPLGTAQTAELVIRHLISQRIDIEMATRYPALRWLSLERILRSRR